MIIVLWCVCFAVYAYVILCILLYRYNFCVFFLLHEGRFHWLFCCNIGNLLFFLYSALIYVVLCVHICALHKIPCPIWYFWYFVYDPVQNKNFLFSINLWLINHSMGYGFCEWCYAMYKNWISYQMSVPKSLWHEYITFIAIRMNSFSEYLLNKRTYIILSG